MILADVKRNFETLEVGKYYLSMNGSVVGPIKNHPFCSLFIWGDGSILAYTPGGSSTLIGDRSFDLVWAIPMEGVEGMVPTSYRIPLGLDTWLMASLTQPAWANTCNQIRMLSMEIRGGLRVILCRPQAAEPQPDEPPGFEDAWDII